MLDMIMIDTELRGLEASGKPIRVGLIGAGFMARGLARQIVEYTPGMRLTAIANRTLEKAEKVCAVAGIRDHVRAESLAQLEAAIHSGKTALTHDAELLCESHLVDVLIDATGRVEYGAEITSKAITSGNNLVSLNAELDATIGPVLKRMADEAGVVYSGCDGDQPAVEMNLYRMVRGMGLTPLVCGNIKEHMFLDRTPETQKKFAAQWGQNPWMVTSFADGTKLSMEQAVVGNATGLGVAQRGMLGYEHRDHIDRLTSAYDVEQLKELGGIVDYTLGATPAPGVYVFATTDDPVQKKYLKYSKLGDGPLYSFYVPYHLLIFEVAMSVARVALRKDVVVASRGEPVVEVLTVAKRDLEAGETLDGIGGFLSYGLCENVRVARPEGLLPMGISEGAVLRRAIPQGEVVKYADVDLPKNLLSVELRRKQDAIFGEGVAATS